MMFRKPSASPEVTAIADRLEQGDLCMVLAEVRSGEISPKDAVDALELQRKRHPIRTLIQNVLAPDSHNE